MSRGRWVKRDGDRHQCRTPVPRLRDAVGSTWECRCGKQWALTTNYLDNNGYTQRYRWAVQP